MPAIQFTHKGDFHKTENFLKQLKFNKIYRQLNKYAQAGVNALASATPKDTGETANSWGYEIDFRYDRVVISWTNSNVNGYAVIALLIQYGHGTGTGGYVEGRDYINPAIKPIFDQILKNVWGEVINA